MQRRTFIASATAALASPLILGAEDKAGSKNPVLGVEGHQYEVLTHNWGELPRDYQWQTTHNVAFDSQGHAYITHQGIGKLMDTILVFDATGKFVRSFGKAFHGGGHGIEIRKEGSEEFCYLSNTWTKELKVMKTTLKGEVVWFKGRPDIKEYADPKVGYSPTNICFLPDGGFVVGDGYGSGYLMRYDRDAKLLNTFGGKGTVLGKFQTPHGQGLDNRVKDKPTLVVCDRANHRLQTFNLNGTPIGATEPNEVVLFPAHARFRGDVLLVADLHARVSLFDKDNKVIAHLGDDEAWRKKVLGPGNVRKDPKQWEVGKFVHPHDANFDAAGNLLVVEWVEPGRVSFLKKIV